MKAIALKLIATKRRRYSENRDIYFVNRCANGNRTSVNVDTPTNTGTPKAYTVSPNRNRLTNIASPALKLAHDAMGNIASDGCSLDGLFVVSVARLKIGEF